MPPRGSEEDYLMSLLVENGCDDGDIRQMTRELDLSVILSVRDMENQSSVRSASLGRVAHDNIAFFEFFP